MFESQISAEATETLPGWKKPRAKTVAWSCDMFGHAQTCVERCCELSNKRKQLYKVSSPCLDDHHFKKEELESVGDLSKVCSQMVFKCLYLVDLTFFGQWTNLLDQSPKRQELVTDVELVWFHTFTTQVATDNVVMWETRLSIVDWVYSKTQILLAALRPQKSTSGGIFCIFGRRTFVPICWMCKKQTSVSHSSTESEIIPLDADVRMDGLPDLDLCDVVTEVLHSSKSTESPTHGAARNCSRNHKSKPKQMGNRDVDQLSHVDCVTTNAILLNVKAHLYIFEDNEEVIKMITKGRSPAMRRVSRTHRVAHERSFGRINLDPKIQIKYFDTKNQLANRLTKGSLTRDEWDHFLRLLNIMNFSMFSCSHVLSNRKQSVMSKRAQESRAGEGSAVAKARPMSLVWKTQQHILKSGDKMILFSCSRKLVRSGESASSGSTRKLVRGDDQIERTSLKFHNMQISDDRYLEKVFKKKKPAAEVRRRCTDTRLASQCTDLGIICVDSDESLCSYWT